MATFEQAAEQQAFAQQYNDMEKQFSEYVGKKCVFVDRDQKKYDAVVNAVKIVRASHGPDDQGRYRNTCKPAFDITVTFKSGGVERHSPICGVYPQMQGIAMQYNSSYVLFNTPEQTSERKR